MFETEVSVNRFLLHYTSGLMKDIPDERIASQPFPGVNHPAWILGHLAFTGDAAVTLLGGEKVLDIAWIKKFGPNSSLSTDREDYPSREELVSLLISRFETAQGLAMKVDPAAMAAPNPKAHMAERLPTVGDLVSFLFTGHMGIHLGQLSTWRRMIGIERLF